MSACNRSVAALALLLAIAATLHAQAPAGQVAIMGRVVAEATGQPVRRAYVIVHGPETSTTRVTMSDGNGAFRFEGLPADRYRVGASKRPLLSATTDVKGTEVVISLPTGAVVTGTVVDSLGQPAPSLDLTISGTGLVAPQVAITNLLGEYRFFSLPPGDYNIAAVRRKAEPRSVAVGPGEQIQMAPLVVEDEARPPILGTAPSKGANVIGGVAVDERSGHPLPHAPVISRRLGLRTVADVDGRFQFEGLGDGSYQLQIEGPGFQPASAAEVTVKDNIRIIDVTLRGGRNGHIAGVVRDEVGDPIVGMPVTASLKRLLNFQMMVQPRGHARTDDRGMFDLRNVPAGEYLLCACAGDPLAIDPGLLRQLGSTAPDAATVTRLIDDTVHIFPPTFYPGMARASDSPAVFVDYGDTRTGMDITMYAAKPFVVSGQLVDEAGLPVAQMQAFLGLDGDIPGAVGVSSIGPVISSADGRFRFSGVPAGTYSLGATPAPPGNRAQWGHTEVTIVDRDIEQLVVPVGRGLKVTGRLEFPAATPRPALLQQARISMFPLRISMMLFLSMGSSGTLGYGAPLDGNGRFSIDNLPRGPHRISVTVAGTPWRVHRVVAAGGEAQDDVLTVDAGGVSDVVVFMTDAPLATLAGTLALDKQRYEAAGFARVTLFPMDAVVWLEPLQYPNQFAWVFVQPDGSFRLENVPPGDYYVVRGSSFDDNMSPRSFEQWSKTAERVTLKAGETTTVTIKR